MNRFSAGERGNPFPSLFSRFFSPFPQNREPDHGLSQVEIREILLRAWRVEGEGKVNVCPSSVCESVSC